MEESRGLGWRRRLALMLTLLLAVSVGARVMQSRAKTDTPTAGDVGAAGGATVLPHPDGPAGTPEQQPQVTEEPTGIRKLLPFVSEGAFAMLLGLAAGIATRMIFKMLVLAVLVFFIATQFLAYKGLLTVDWGHFLGWMRDFVLNVSEKADFTSIVQHKLPAVGAFLIGTVLGLKRG